jgi:hypothetical protein
LGGAEARGVAAAAAMGVTVMIRRVSPELCSPPAGRAAVFGGG